MKFRSRIMSTTLFCLSFISSHAQTYDVQKLLEEKKFKLNLPQPYAFDDNESGKKVIGLSGIAWLKGVEFSTGTIEVDLRGQNVFQRSFIGIAFHGIDSAIYDAVYFRPFNFRAEDPERKIHAVQYMALPDNDWSKLRDEQNGVYEKGITPAPAATDWFHAKIEVTKDEIIVYVNNSTKASLKVKKLNSRTTGQIALWNEGLDGQFANLVISK
ncbi:MAG: hypothetical protein ABI477_04360 [Chryseolinea sp.]